jgi:hypothetical protein
MNLCTSCLADEVFPYQLVIRKNNIYIKSNFQLSISNDKNFIQDTVRRDWEEKNYLLMQFNK